MFVQTFLDFVSQKALSIVIADGCECNALSVSNWMKMGKCFPLFPVFQNDYNITAVELAFMSEISKFRTSSGALILLWRTGCDFIRQLCKHKIIYKIR